MIVKVFFDTNVIVDAFTLRDNSYVPSRDLIRAVISEEIDGYICSKQITDIYYILRKYVQNKIVQKNVIKDISESFKLLPLLGSDISASFGNKIDDYEDAVLEEVAKVNVMKYFVTNNKNHFKNSKMCVVTPEELVTLLEAGKN